MATLSPSRVPQQDRSRATRHRLLEAAVDCLAEDGWARSTVAGVAERAGVSRGAAQHHFPTREALFTAAVRHVADRRLAEVRAIRPKGTRAVVDRIVGFCTGPVFRAALALWVAAAAEPALREQIVELEAHIGRETHRAAVDLLGADESRPGVRESIQATLDLARGLGLAALLSDDTRRRAGIVDQWARMLDAALTA
jgi:AcrR family transcriptional regulator